MSDIEPFAAAVRKLLRGVVYYDDSAWSQIQDYQSAVRQYLVGIGLGLYVDDIGGFAYLHDISRDDEGQNTLPALTTRRNLSFLDTLLLVLLRERLDEHEMRDLDNIRLFLTQEDVRDMLLVFMGNHPDARKVDQNIESVVNRLVRYGFLTKRNDGRFEVRSLIRAKISADMMGEIREQLQAYLGQNHAAEETESEFVE